MVVASHNQIFRIFLNGSYLYATEFSKSDRCKKGKPKGNAGIFGSLRVQTVSFCEEIASRLYVMEPDKGTSYSNISASAARILGKGFFDL